MRNKTEVCPICHKPIRYHHFSGKIEKQCDHKIKVKMRIWFILYIITNVLFFGSMPTDFSLLERESDLVPFLVGDLIAELIILSALIFPVYFIAGFDNTYKVKVEDEKQK